MIKRITGGAPRLVGKALEGEQDTPKGGEAEATKWELQSFLDTLASASDQTQESMEDLENLILAMLGTEAVPASPIDPAGLHLFHGMGA